MRDSNSGPYPLRPTGLKRDDLCSFFVQALFSSPNCPRFVSCEMTLNNMCYVTFDSDEDAQKAYRFLREEVPDFKVRPAWLRLTIFLIFWSFRGSILYYIIFIFL